MRYTRQLLMLTTLIAALSAPAAALACGNAMNRPEPIACVIIISLVVGFFWLLSLVLVLIAKSFVTFDAKKPALILTALALMTGGVWFTASRLRPEPPTLYRLAEVEHRLSQGAQLLCQRAARRPDRAVAPRRGGAAVAGRHGAVARACLPGWYQLHVQLGRGTGRRAALCGRSGGGIRAVFG